MLTLRSEYRGCHLGGSWNVWIEQEGRKRMKIFQYYNPLKVEKYVKTLFRGQLYIKDIGAFEFDKGKNPDVENPR